MKIFFITGEKSGVNILLEILKKLKNKEEKIELLGIGDEFLSKSLDAKIIFNYHEINFIGITDVILNIRNIFQKINFTAEKIIQFQPDIIISVDSYDFCIRVLKKVRKHFNKNQIPAIHIVAPSVWAYFSHRAKTLAENYNLLFCFLPFEPEYFRKHGLESIFVGNLSLYRMKERKELIKKDKNIIAITLGSRLSEIKKHIELIKNIIKEISRSYPKINFKIISTKDTMKFISHNLKGVEKTTIISEENKILCMQKAILAIAKSGTNAIEFSFFETPVVVYYKVSILNFILAKLFLKIKFVNLLNIISNKNIVPEYIGYKVNKTLILKEITRHLENEKVRELQIKESNLAIKKMMPHKNLNPIDSVSDLIYAKYF